MEIKDVLAIVAAGLAVSEGLTLIPAIKSNGIFQFIYFILKAIYNGIKSKEV